MKAAAIAATLVLAAAVPARAGSIETACLASGRPGVSPPLCGCIQDVADRTLTGADQRRAARFFADPHRAQETRQADGSASEAFWKRYKNFGIAAESSCAGL